MNERKIYGKLNNPIQPVNYVGENTESAETLVNNRDRIIKVNVKNNAFKPKSTSTIDTTIHNNEISSSLLVNSMWGAISTNSVVRELEFDVSLDTDTVCNIIRDVFGGEPSDEDYVCLLTTSGNTLVKMAWEQESNSLAIAVYQPGHTYPYMPQDYVVVFSSLLGGWIFNSGIPEYEGILSGDGRISLDSAYTINRLAEDNLTPSYWNGTLITSTSIGDDVLVLGYDGDKVVNTGINAKQIVTTAFQYFTEEDIHSLLEKLGIRNANDYEY